MDGAHTAGLRFTHGYHENISTASTILLTIAISGIVPFFPYHWLFLFVLQYHISTMNITSTKTAGLRI